jgi:hypothetical protein
MTTNGIRRIAAKVVISGSLALTAMGLAAGTAHAWNPQPDPPRNPNNSYSDPHNSYIYNIYESPKTDVTSSGGTVIGPTPIGPSPNGGGN